jgi:hypothetical protein
MCVWNDFMWPLIAINKESMRTIQVGIAYFTDSNTLKYGPTMAASFIASIPILAIFAVANRHFVAGLTMTGIKGYQEIYRKKALSEILASPASRYFSVEGENGKSALAIRKASMCQNRIPGSLFWHWKQQGYYLCRPNGEIRCITFINGNEYADTVPGVWVHKWSRVFKKLFVISRQYYYSLCSCCRRRLDPVPGGPANCTDFSPGCS